MCSGTGRMYASDPLARLYVRHALDVGYMERVEPELRLFFCLAFAHSEDLVDQDLSVQAGSYRYFLKVDAVMHTATPSSAAQGNRMSRGLMLMGIAR
ncbi:DUF924 family protein [Pseudomonas aeruginosa]|nr:DUF924 family protein [Pseudomonas aeruginosa]